MFLLTFEMHPTQKFWSSFTRFTFPAGFGIVESTVVMKEFARLFFLSGALLGIYIAFFPDALKIISIPANNAATKISPTIVRISFTSL